MATHRFTLKASWTGGLSGEGRIAVGNLESAISVPKDMKGPGVGTNPEELLVGSAATCYLITLSAILERRQIPVERLELQSEGEVELEGASLRFTRITHRPRIQLSLGATEEQRTTARDATLRAEKACMISNALRGNVQLAVDPQIS
jgi:peroxiredoxin-like protein